MKWKPLFIIVGISFLLAIGLSVLGNWAYDNHFNSGPVTIDTHTFFVFMQTAYLMVGGLYAAFVAAIVITYYYNLTPKAGTKT